MGASCHVTKGGVPYPQAPARNETSCTLRFNANNVVTQRERTGGAGSQTRGPIGDVDGFRAGALGLFSPPPVAVRFVLQYGLRRVNISVGIRNAVATRSPRRQILLPASLAPTDGGTTPRHLPPRFLSDCGPDIPFIWFLSPPFRDDGRIFFFFSYIWRHGRNVGGGLGGGLGQRAALQTVISQRRGLVPFPVPRGRCAARSKSNFEGGPRSPLPPLKLSSFFAGGDTAVLSSHLALCSIPIVHVRWISRRNTKGNRRISVIFYYIGPGSFFFPSLCCAILLRPIVGERSHAGGCVRRCAAGIP